MNVIYKDVYKRLSILSVCMILVKNNTYIPWEVSPAQDKSTGACWGEMHAQAQWCNIYIEDEAFEEASPTAPRCHALNVENIYREKEPGDRRDVENICYVEVWRQRGVLAFKGDVVQAGFLWSS